MANYSLLTSRVSCRVGKFRFFLQRYLSSSFVLIFIITVAPLRVFNILLLIIITLKAGAVGRVNDSSPHLFFIHSYLRTVALHCLEKQSYQIVIRFSLECPVTVILFLFLYGKIPMIGHLNVF